MRAAGPKLVAGAALSVGGGVDVPAPPGADGVAVSAGIMRPVVLICARSRLQAPLMKFHASDGRTAAGVVRTVMPVPRPRSPPCAASAAFDATGTSSRSRFGQGPVMMSSRSGFRLAASAWPGRSPTISTPRRL